VVRWRIASCGLGLVQIMTVLAQRHVIGEFRARLFARFGLNENPFGVTPNAKYLYESHTHREAKSSLIIGLECGVGFQALIASPGMGKTTILSHILQRFQRNALTALLFQIQGNSIDFLRYLLSELGSTKPVLNLAGAQETVNQLLVKQYRDRRPVIIVIDEAQNLNTEVMETIRLLSNFETASDKLLQIILSGQPQLAEKLARPELTQLSQRISILATLTPFDQADTGKYIEHRLSVAGYGGPRLFTPGAVFMLWKHSQGIPRNINTLCFNALLLAGSAGWDQIDEATISNVVKDRNLEWLALPVAGEEGMHLDLPSTTREECELHLSAEAKQSWRRQLPSLHAGPGQSTFLRKLRTLVAEGKLSQKAMLQRISEAAEVLTHANGAVIALRRNNSYICEARVGDTGPELGGDLDMDQGISAECLRVGAPLRCDDINKDGRADGEFCRRLGLRSLVVVPVGRESVVSGLLEAFSALPGAFSDSDVELLEELAELVEQVIAGQPCSVQPLGHKRSKFSSASWSRPAFIAATALLVLLGWPDVKTKQDIFRLSAAAPHRVTIPLPSLVRYGSVPGFVNLPASPAASPLPAVTAPQVVAGPFVTAIGAAVDYRNTAVARPSAVVNANKTETARPTDDHVIRKLESEAASTTNPAPTPGQGITRLEVPPVLSALSATDDPALLAVLSASDTLPILETRFSQGVSGGTIQRQVKPTYPPEALAQRIAGRVLLHAVVTETGRVSNLKLVNGDGLLGRAAMEAVAQWRYQPYQLNGQPIKFPTYITIVFKLPR